MTARARTTQGQPVLTLSSRVRAYLRDERGSSNAVAFIPAAVMVVAIFTVALHITIASIGQTAAQGAAVATYNQGRLYGASASSAEAYGQQLIDEAVGVLGGDVTVTTTAETVTVTVVGEVATIMPGLPNRIEATVSGPVERWVD